MRIARSLFLAALTVAGCGARQSPSETKAVHPVDVLAADYWQAGLERSPTSATLYGDRRYDAVLPDLSEPAQAAWTKKLTGFRERLVATDVTQAEMQPKLTARVLQTLIDNELGLRACEKETWDVDQLNGWQSSLAELASYQIIDSEVAAAAYVERLANAGLLLDQHMKNLSRGLAAGRTAPRIVVERVLVQLGAMLGKAPEEMPFVDIVARTKNLDDSQKERLKADIIAVTRTGIVPALVSYQAFLKDTYLPKARTQVGVLANTEGRACYQALITHHTGLDLTPEQIHALGEQEMQRLTIKMNEVAVSQGFADRAAYLTALKQDPASFLPSRDALLEHNRALVQKAWDALPKAFSTLPKNPPLVRAIETFRENESPAAYYYPSADDGSRPSYYYVNTGAPETRPLYNMEALAYHEAVPGHHLQIALAQELIALPEVRRHADFTAFVEGWGLYSELLADELGLYSSPKTRFGMYNYQAWRAARLVVDTGMHALGWSREQAIAYMKDHVALPESEIINEVDRYIIWPGQALAYMLGRMEIMRLREEAKKKQGAQFSLAAFHEQVLLHGPVPLGVLANDVLR